MLRRVLVTVGLAVAVVGTMAVMASPGLQPRLPVELGGPDGLVVVQSREGGPSHALLPGDRLMAIGEYELVGVRHLDFILDGMRAGQRVTVKVARSGKVSTESVTLTGGLNSPVLAVNALVGALFWLFGMLVVWQGRLERDVLLFFAMAMTLSLVILAYCPENDLGLGAGGKLLGALLSHGLYPLTVTLLLHFSVYFPSGAPAWTRAPLLAFYLASAALSCWLLATMVPAHADPRPAAWAAYESALRVLRLHLPLVFALSPLLWLMKLRRARRLSTRKKLKWLLWGFAVGISPHLLLYELPQGLGRAPLVPELVTIPLSVLAAASVLVAVARYRLLDINLVINRSIVYLVLSAALVVVYLVLVAIGDAWLAAGSGTTASFWVRVPVVLILALAFAPARQLAQDWVDRIFFRRRHDQRLALMELSRLAAATLDIFELSRQVEVIVDQVLGVESVAVYLSDAQRQQLHPVAGTILGRKDSIAIEELDRLLDDRAVVVHADVPGCEGYELLAALRTGQGLAGLLAVGPRRSGAVFDDDDLRFCDAVAAQTALAFERARVLQQLKEVNRQLEQKVYERTAQLAQANDRLVEQYQRLQKLDELKESMTRMVVHDLRNPLTTIALGAELALADCQEVSAEMHRTLKLIHETAAHMDDLVQSMLDTARIEAGTLQVRRQAVNLAGLLNESCERLHILAETKQVGLVVEQEAVEEFSLDEGLMGRVLVNLLANAIRHSPAGQPVTVTARPLADGKLRIGVANQGPPVPEALQDRIFDKFFRASEARGSASTGAGLGLHFCRMVTEAHGGEISVCSPLPGSSRGAEFILVIPAVEK